jgi:signal transduction histidine kinase
MSDPSVRTQSIVHLSATATELAQLMGELRARGMAAKPGDAGALRAVRMEAAAQTARVLAHEIANYLGSIRTMLYLLEDEVSAGSEAQTDLHAVVQTVEAGTQFLGAIRGFVHAEPLGAEPADLNAVMRDAEGELRSALPSRAALALRLSDGPLWVRGEALRLARLAADLVAAIASGMAAGSEVVLETGRDGAAPRAGDSAALLVVRARGRVLEPDALERIFEPFVADRGHEGGLRLPTVYAVVTESGGTVAAASSPAEGTTIRIGLPVADPPEGGKGSAP